MAQKKSSGIVQELMTIGFLLLMGLAFILPFLLTAAYYAFPIGLLWWWSKASTGGPPTQADIAPVDAKAALKELKVRKKELEEQYQELISEGVDEGVRYIENEERFERRSNRGQQLNSQLESLKEDYAHLENEIEIMKHPEHRQIDAWLTELRSWYRGQAFRVACVAAVAAFAAICVVVEIYSVTATLRLAIFQMIWNPAPAIFRQSTFAGALGGWIVGLPTLFFARGFFERKADQTIDELFSDEGDEIAEDDEAEDAESAPEDDSTGKRWEEILNVSSEASDDEIKKAYKEAIRKCHPDTVADRSDLIREAAMNEAQRINVAYQEARSERGF